MRWLLKQEGEEFEEPDAETKRKMGKVSMKALKKFNTNVQTWQELTQSWNDVLEEEKQLIADKDKMGITSE